jgi:hypothetical protein
MSEKYYSEVYDIPLFNWERVLEGDYQFMRVEPNKKKFGVDDINAFNILYNNYIDKYGLSGDQKKTTKLQRQYVKLYVQYVETNNEFILNQLGMIEDDLLKMRKAVHKGMTISQTLVWLSKWMGGSWINKKEMTLDGFKVLIQEYERANEKK